MTTILVSAYIRLGTFATANFTSLASRPILQFEMIFGTKHAIIRYAFRINDIARSVFLLLKDQKALWPINLLEPSTPSNNPRTNWTIFFW